MRESQIEYETGINMTADLRLQKLADERSAREEAFDDSRHKELLEDGWNQRYAIGLILQEILDELRLQNQDKRWDMYQYVVDRDS